MILIISKKKSQARELSDILDILGILSYPITAKDAFNQLGLKKLPTRKELNIEFHQLLTAKKEAYAEYRQVRDDLKDYQIAKKAMDVILNKDRQQEEEKEKRQER